jgi:hypothetical protein
VAFDTVESLLLGDVSLGRHAAQYHRFVAAMSPL